MFIDKWIGTEDVADIYNGILLSHKKEWNIAFYSDMDETRDSHDKESKKEKDEYHMISLICRI